MDMVVAEALTGRENLRFHAGLFGLYGRERAARIAGVLKLVQFSDRADDRVSTYSGGMKRRLGLARPCCQRSPLTPGVVHASRSWRAGRTIADVSH